MFFRFLFLLLLVPSCFAAECTAYEKIHPTYILTGAHLSTGKCQTCGSCHKNGMFVGTPKLCVNCHVPNAGYDAAYMSVKHLPTGVLNCDGCHSTTVFTTALSATNIHKTAVLMRCDSCHNGSYTSYGARGKPRDHPTTVTKNGVKILVTSVDCNYCHRTTGW